MESLQKNDFIDWKAREKLKELCPRLLFPIGGNNKFVGYMRYIERYLDKPEYIFILINTFNHTHPAHLTLFKNPLKFVIEYKKRCIKADKHPISKKSWKIMNYFTFILEELESENKYWESWPYLVDGRKYVRKNEK